MGQILIVSKVDNLSEYKKLSDEYQLGFEFNDFYMPDLLDDEDKLTATIKKYKDEGLPDYCTMHGVFFDIIPFSYDAKIRKVSEDRMVQSMEIAKELGAKAVIFHTNYNPLLENVAYDDNVVEQTVSTLEKLLRQYPDINVYVENMFDSDAHIMKRIAQDLQPYSNFGLCLDYAHASIFGTDIDAWVKDVAPYVKHIHINDNDLKKDLHLAVGDGEIDWKLFKKYYEQFFTNCSLLIETMSVGAQKKSIEFMIQSMGLNFK